MGLIKSWISGVHHSVVSWLLFSDVKRGQNLEAEAKSLRPELRGWGQDYEVEAKAEAK